METIKRLRIKIMDEVTELLVLNRFLQFFEEIIEELGIADALDNQNFDIAVLHDPADERLGIKAEFKNGKMKMTLLVNSKWLVKYTSLPPKLFDDLLRALAAHEAIHVHQLVREGPAMIRRYEDEAERYEEEVKQVAKNILGYYIDDLAGKLVEKRKLFAEFVERIPAPRDEAEPPKLSQETFRLFIKSYQELKEPSEEQ